MPEKFQTSRPHRDSCGCLLLHTEALHLPQQHGRSSAPMRAHAHTLVSPQRLGSVLVSMPAVPADFFQLSLTRVHACCLAGCFLPSRPRAWPPPSSRWRACRCRRPWSGRALCWSSCGSTCTWLLVSAPPAACSVGVGW